MVTNTEAKKSEDNLVITTNTRNIISHLDAIDAIMNGKRMVQAMSDQGYPETQLDEFKARFKKLQEEAFDLLQEFSMAE